MHERPDFEHDPDDPPPQTSYADMHWWYLNRWAEELARLLALFGLY